MVSLLGREAVAEKLVVLCCSVGWSASVEKVLVVGCLRFLVAGWRRKSARRAGGGGVKHRSPIFGRNSPTFVRNSPTFGRNSPTLHPLFTETHPIFLRFLRIFHFFLSTMAQKRAVEGRHRRKHIKRRRPNLPSGGGVAKSRVVRRKAGGPRYDT